MRNKNKTPKDENGKPHGYWEVYWENGKLSYKGSYIHGYRHGYWEVYHSNGKIRYNGYFIHGKRYGFFNDYYYYYYYDKIIYQTTKNKFLK